MTSFSSLSVIEPRSGNVSIASDLLLRKDAGLTAIGTGSPHATLPGLRTIIDQKVKLSFRVIETATQRLRPITSQTAARRLRPIQSMTAASKIALVLVLAIVVAGGVARNTAIGTNTHLSADENGYVGNANRILADERYATFKWPPGTSIAFAIATRLSSHHSLKLTTQASGPAQYTQLAAGVLTLMLVAVLAWVFAGPWAAVLAT